MTNRTTWEYYHGLGREPEPHELLAIYDGGFQGTIPDRYTERRMYAALPDFYADYPEAKGRGSGVVCLPFRAALTLEPEFGRYERQTTGDCVSHGTRNAGMLDYCIDALFGETEYKGRLATEPIYGYRGHGGQGASCARLCQYVSQEGPGGFLPRADYSSDGGVDLSVYDSRIGHNWGPRGTPDAINRLAAQNKALRVYRCTGLEMARDALALGFGLNRCGSAGWSSTRNEDGVSRRRGGWAHAMAIIGSDDSDAMRQKYDDGLVLIQNSWGMWNSGPKRHDQPDGSYWTDGRHFDRECQSGGVFVIASVRGYNRELVYDTASSQAYKELVFA